MSEEKGKLYITVQEWEKQNKREYPFFGPIWYYDDYGECWACCLWKERKKIIELARKEPPPTHAAWAIDYEPLVLDINLAPPSDSDAMRYQLLEREAKAPEEQNP